MNVSGEVLIRDGVVFEVLEIKWRWRNLKPMVKVRTTILDDPPTERWLSPNSAIKSQLTLKFER